MEITEITYRFTNETDAVHFARAQHGVDVEIVHEGRGRWIVITSKDENPEFNALLKQMSNLSMMPLDARERFDEMLKQNFTGSINDDEIEEGDYTW